MSIDHLFLTAVCLFWAYLLLCLTLKLFLDGLGRRHLGRKQALIDDFFLPGHTAQERQAALPTLQRFVADRQLLRYVCDSFAALDPDFPADEREELRRIVQHLLHLQQRRDPGDSLNRAVLAWELRRCSLRAPEHLSSSAGVR